MAKVFWEISSGQRQATSVVQPSFSDRRWLIAKHQAPAIKELRDRMKRAGKDKDDPAEDSEGRLWAIAGDKEASSWHALENRIIRSWNNRSQTWRGTNQLAAHLLKVSVEEITTTTPPDQVSRKNGDGSGEKLQISYPGRIAEHRAVILGEIPSNLHPALFIEPQDGRQYWYPQCGLEGKHNPLRVGSAFACFAHFGNPNWIAQTPPVNTYRVRVYALEKAWTYGSNRITEEELAKKLGDLNCRAKVEVKVERSSPIDAVTISDGGTVSKVKKSHRWKQRIEKIVCRAPVEIGWTGQQDAYIEVRSGVGDYYIVSDLVGPPVVLTLPGGRAPRRGKSLDLEGPGLYRVRLYPVRYSFVDPPYEWWLDVRAQKVEKAKSVTLRRPAPRGPFHPVLGPASRQATPPHRRPA